MDGPLRAPSAVISRGRRREGRSDAHSLIKFRIVKITFEMHYVRIDWSNCVVSRL